jgi:catechol 2,3-dioxygenase-like lactoylglutathione lyase family enzyme
LSQLTASAKRVLHVNINVVDLPGSAAVYEAGLAMRCLMRSDAMGAEVANDPLGHSGPTDSVVLFYYDHRGGRKAPAIELVNWISPATSGLHYGQLWEIGMQGVAFAVPDVEAAAQQLIAHGAQVSTSQVAGGIDQERQLLVDRDGVAVELFADIDMPAPTFRRIRMTVSDLERSVEWYQAIGWSVIGDPFVERWVTPERPAGTDARIRRLTLERDPALELWLTQWPNEYPVDGPRTDSHHRGLFRMALSVDDVEESVAALASDLVTIPPPTSIPLPGAQVGTLLIAFLHDPDSIIVELVPRP